MRFCSVVVLVYFVVACSDFFVLFVDLEKGSVECSVVDQGDDDDDGLINVEEKVLGTDPIQFDLDGDIYIDYEELLEKMDLLDGES